jgi:hypothetical protein
VMCSPSTSWMLRSYCSAVRRRRATGPASTSTGGAPPLLHAESAQQTKTHERGANNDESIEMRTRSSFSEADDRRGYAQARLEAIASRFSCEICSRLGPTLRKVRPCSESSSSSREPSTFQ